MLRVYRGGGKLVKAVDSFHADDIIYRSSFSIIVAGPCVKKIESVVFGYCHSETGFCDAVMVV